MQASFNCTEVRKARDLQYSITAVTPEHNISASPVLDMPSIHSDDNCEGDYSQRIGVDLLTN